MNNMDTALPKKKKRKRKKRSKTSSAILTALLIVFMIGVTTCGMIVLDIFSDVGLITIGKNNPENDVAGVDYIDLDAYIANQSLTTMIYAYDENNNEKEIARLHGTENRIWCDLDDVCDYMKKAVVALEDKRFYSHKGVDWIRTIAVVVEYSFSQGGSTITQQLIKNLTGENGRTFIRKYNEIKNALRLEKHFDKDQILEAYLNTIYLDMGCYGIKTAAEYYFGKTPAELTLMESAILISITNAPRKYNPILNYDNNRERATECLNCMLEQGAISQEEYDAALKEEVSFVGELSKKEEDTEDVETEYNSYYVDFIIDTVIEDLKTKYGYTAGEAYRKIYYGGLKIYAAVDLDVQSEMEDVYYNRVTFPDEEDTAENPAIQSSMVILDYEGRVVGIVGRLGPKTGNRMGIIAADSPRQPGSSIKPLSCYAPAIELNYYYWSSYLPNYGIPLRDGSIWPTNYGGVTGSISDLRNLPQAIAPSLNTIPARIVDTIGPSECYKFLRDRFRISTLDEAGDVDYAPMATGAMTYGVTALEMAAAYATFGNGGLYYSPWCYYKVTNSAGDEVLLEPNRTGEQVISAGTADVMNHLLQCVVTYPNGTGHRFAIDGFTTFSKSGTTSDNKDKWIVGGSPYYICASWAGFEIPEVINTAYYGSNPAGSVYKEVMTRIHKGLEAKEFTFSDECVRRTYCTTTGLLASNSCSGATGYYKVDYMPAVCTRCGGGGAADNDPGYDIPQF